MKLMYLSFTERGERLAKSLAAELGGVAERCGEAVSLAEWTKKGFSEADGLVFVGAAGIAVRAIAPYLRHKGIDPAVVVVEEQGRFAIPILSGHLGGANALAKKISKSCGAIPVITTATDVNGIFAIDTWAKAQNCEIRDLHKIKEISGALLAGKKIRLRSDWQITGTPPKQVILTETGEADAWVSICRREDTLEIIPKIAVLGVGCRRGISAEQMEETFCSFLQERGIRKEAICLVASIDLKREEKGILEFCKAHGFPFDTYSAEELGQAEGVFTASAFVKQITGVDSVCERSAVLGSGGKLYCKKYVGQGVTMALALRPFQPDWRWQDE